MFSEATFVTWGQVILALPLMGLFLAGYYMAFVSPDVEGSGKIAGYALIAVYLTANKSNSIFSYFLGISFERMIIYHNMSSVMAVVLGLLHAYVPFAYGDSDSSDSEGGESISADSSADRRLDDSDYSLIGNQPNLLKWAFDGDENTSGTLLILSMILLVLLSLFSDLSSQIL